MSSAKQWIAFLAIVRVEVQRIFRMWTQTILAPALTSALYFLIFGKVIGQRMGSWDGHSYLKFIAPGLVMMSMIISSYDHTGFAFYLARFQRCIEEMLVSSMKNLTMLLGYVAGGVIRGLIVALVISMVALLLVDIQFYSLVVIITMAVLVCTLFSLVGMINAIYAKTFDGIAFIPTFVLTPMSFLGGVFYSVQQLAPFWRTLSFFNPITHFIEVFRYGFLGIQTPYLKETYIGLSGLILVVFFYVAYLIRIGKGIKT
ncbi:MAG TPA: ABC transporter permease [Coxiellaceae bacterium]|nr:ABC transporter permease [Coxiellaceae bacterium]